MRFSANNKGKSGGVRVCYLDIPLNDTSIFILVYAKNKKENLSKSEEQEISKLVAELKSFYKEV
ncbi:type II toxin-antitoxin system RelE/ParE family toxin [Peptoniphilus sp. MSJ-1]|uniref:Type II toxin-antitoxin system RelE/ParE family toxin n=1 Tax=Peptoniphilus ovalis TaxID=2841503 RepID=A0ABS6FGX1_9FIRM|nr:type II toxin-antitoxin system RelE/ParE family toxin [Peptoniphilus ovalis]MBU5668506.1 type II toxin-antitoxin system RelE/ParE family toxin [Peptoniphilus ovalis]